MFNSLDDGGRTRQVMTNLPQGDRSRGVGIRNGGDNRTAHSPPNNIILHVNISLIGAIVQRIKLRENHVVWVTFSLHEKHNAFISIPSTYTAWHPRGHTNQRKTDIE